MFLGLGKEQWKSMLRTFTTIALTWLVSSGKLTNEQMGQITTLAVQAAPILAIVGTVVWGIITRSPGHIATAAGALPGVQVKADLNVAPASVVAAAISKDNNYVSPV
jgi:hypothetical protein